MTTPPSVLTLQTVVCQGSDQVSCELDGETVLMHLDSGEYFGYDAVGSRIWQLLAEPLTVETLCARLVEAFQGVAPAQCRADVLAFLEALHAEGLVDVVTKEAA